MKKYQHLMFALTMRVEQGAKILRCNPEDVLR